MKLTRLKFNLAPSPPPEQLFRHASIRLKSGAAEGLCNAVCAGFDTTNKTHIDRFDNGSLKNTHTGWLRNADVSSCWLCLVSFQQPCSLRKAQHEVWGPLGPRDISGDGRPDLMVAGESVQLLGIHSLGHWSLCFIVWLRMRRRQCLKISKYEFIDFFIDLAPFWAQRNRGDTVSFARGVLFAFEVLWVLLFSSPRLAASFIEESLFESSN